MSKRLIINADDFGFDPDASEAILDLLEKRRISSTTVMANLVLSKDLERLKNIPQAGIGLHVNLLDGKPLSPGDSVNSLIDESCEFLGAKKLFQKAFLGQISSREIHTEIEAQVNFLRDHGIQLTHADSHQHLHQFPILGKMIRESLSKLGVKKLRNSGAVEVNLKPRSLILAGFTRFSPIEKSFQTTEGLISELSFGGEIEESKFWKSIKNSFRQKSLLELMTHPGLEDRPGSYLARKAEFELWNSLDTEKALNSLGIELVNFGKI